MSGAGDERAALEEFFEVCVHACLDEPELMAEYRRLYGSTLGLNTRSPIEQMVDRATGHDPHAAEYAPFLRFVRDCVWLPLLRAHLPVFAARERLLSQTASETSNATVPPGDESPAKPEASSSEPPSSGSLR